MSNDHLLLRLRRILADRYRFETYLGRGGSASVYTVTNLRLDRLEAFKVLAESQQGNDEFTDRFANEARLAASLDHPNIVKIYDFGDSDGICWFSMQLVEGPSLSSELHARRTFTAESTVELSLPILDALHFSHEQGIIHRDVKPSNIILDRTGRPFLMDFGIAKSSGSMLETRTGLVLGTPAYVAPEQASGQSLDGRADVYAVGVTLYQMLCGGYPFTAENPLQTVVMRMTQDPEPLRDKLPDVDSQLDAIVMRALAKDRDLRFESALEMKLALAELQDRWGGKTDLVPRAKGPGRGRPLVFDDDEGRSTRTLIATSGSEARELRWVRRKRQVRLGTWIAAGAGALLLGVFSLLQLGSASREGPRIAAVATPTVATARAVTTPTPAAVREVGTIASEVDTPSEPAVQSTATPRPEPPTPAPTRPPSPAPLRPFHWPKLLSRPAAEIPREVEQTCAGQSVRLMLEVDKSGAVVDANVRSTGHPAGCAQHAQEAVRQWEFVPATTIDGIAVPGTMMASYEFPEVGEHE
jgi:hypothetical protein